MTNISMNTNIHRELNYAHTEQRDAIKPVINSLTKADRPSVMLDAIKPLSTVAADSRYEVVCPNCGRVEFASIGDLFKHKCNCGYGVFVEMLRTSPPLRSIN